MGGWRGWWLLRKWNPESLDREVRAAEERREQAEQRWAEVNAAHDRIDQWLDEMLRGGA